MIKSKFEDKELASKFIERQKALANLDAFTASPQENLTAATIKYLTSTYPESGSQTLYRILFASSEAELKKMLHVKSLNKFEKCKHSSSRCTSWTTSYSVTEKMLYDNDADGDFACIIKATVDGSDIVLDVKMLSAEDKKEVYLFDQKEVIVKPGNYSAEIVTVHEY